MPGLKRPCRAFAKRLECGEFVATVAAQKLPKHLTASHTLKSAAEDGAVQTLRAIFCLHAIRLRFLKLPHLPNLRQRFCMNRYEFHLQISSEQYLDYYRGEVRSVVARTADGQTVQFPASLLQRFVTHDGIYGSFILTCDDQFKNAEMERLAPPTD